MKIFGREPTLWLQLLAAALTGIVTLGDSGHPIFGLTNERAGLVVAFVAAILGAINVFAVRPVMPAVFQAVLTTAFPLVQAYGVHVAPAQLAAAQGLLLAVIVLLTRGQVTPAGDQAPTTPATGPVR